MAILFPFALGSPGVKYGLPLVVPACPPRDTLSELVNLESPGMPIL